MKNLIFTLLALFIVSISFSQTKDTYTIEDIIVLAQSDAPQVKLAEMRKSNAYWTNQSFLSNYRPQINLDVQLPQLNRSIQPVVQPTGATAFRAQSQMINSARISLAQNITATGASVFASTGIQRLDVFQTDLIDRSIDYQTNPIFIGFTQPLFGFNELKWDKRIFPMRYQEAQAKFSEEMEAVANQAVQRFFELLNAQTNLKAAEERKVIADDLYKLGENRFSVGNIAETDLLQLEMDVMRANSDISRAKLDQQTANEALRNFLGILDNVQFELELDLEIPDVEIDMDKALSNARANTSRIMELQRTLLEAEQEMERTKAATGINGELTGSVGITGFGSNVADAYGNLLDQEIITLGLSIPIADWGKAKSRYEIQKSNYELTRLNTELQKVNFENEVKIAVQQFALIKENVEVARLSYEASQKRYDLTKKRYVIGKVDVTQLNLADREQEAQRQNYVAAINRFWQAYYDIRSLTLYDFLNDRSLVRESGQE